MEKKKNLPLTLTVVTPEKTFPSVECDSIILTVKDNSDGKGGGSYGIKNGHARALMATDKGFVRAKAGDEEVFSLLLGEGFAEVNKNHIIITADIA